VHIPAGFSVVGDAKDAVSPVIHLQLADSAGQERHQALQTLQHIADTALKRSNVLFTVNKTSALDRVQLTPSIRWPPPLPPAPVLPVPKNAGIFHNLLESPILQSGICLQHKASPAMGNGFEVHMTLFWVDAYGL